MFEVLVYLFENYLDTEVRPDAEVLTDELSAAGFDRTDIEHAFAWFSTLEDMTRETELHPQREPAGLRIYADQECEKISGECRSFLMFLEQAGVIQPSQRELVIDRAMALPDSTVTLERIRWIMLMSLWSQGKASDYLFIEDTVFSATPPTMH